MMGSASSAHKRYILHMLTTRHWVLEHRGCACVYGGSASRPCVLRLTTSRLMRVGLGCLLNTLLVGRATYTRGRSTSPRAIGPTQSNVQHSTLKPSTYTVLQEDDPLLSPFTRLPPRRRSPTPGSLEVALGLPESPARALPISPRTMWRNPKCPDVRPAGRAAAAAA